MRFILLLLTVLLCNPAYALNAKFVTFPALGMCNGTYVRYRDNPDTDGEILGRLNVPERVIVVGSTAVDGKIWYEIEDPHADGTAFVFGKYIEPVYDETTQQSTLYTMMINIIQTYGITPDRYRLYDWSDVKAEHREGDGLVHLEAGGKGCSFGDVSIGDTTAHIRNVLGEPDIMSDDEWEYRLEVDTVFLFKLKDGKITRMIFDE